MIIAPIPLKNPEITGYGIYLIRFGIEVSEIIICNIDAIKRISIIFEISPLTNV